MSKRLRDNFNIRIKQPIDKRHVCANTNDIDTPYEGLMTFNTTDKKFYSYVDSEYVDFLESINNNLADINTSITSLENNKVTKGELACNVFDYGAIGDGVANDTIAFVNAIASGAKYIYVPFGTYIINANQLVLGANQVLKGISARGCILKINGTNSTGVTLNGLGSALENIGIMGDRTGTSGAGVYIIGSGSYLKDVYVKDTYNGIQIGNSTTHVSIVYMSNITIETTLYTGIYVENANDIFLTNFVINGGSVTPSFAIFLKNMVEAFSALNGDVIYYSYSLQTDATNNAGGQRPAYCKFTNVYFDSSASGVSVNKCVATSFTNCWFSNRPSNGCIIQNTDDITFDGCEFINNGSSGLVISATSVRTKVIGCSIIANNSNANGSNGINIIPATTDFIISQCTISNGLGFTGLQNYGIMVNTGASDRYIINNNLVSGNVSGGVSDGGSGVNKNVSNNF